MLGSGCQQSSRGRSLTVKAADAISGRVASPQIALASCGLKTWLDYTKPCEQQLRHSYGKESRTALKCLQTRRFSGGFAHTALKAAASLNTPSGSASPWAPNFNPPWRFRAWPGWRLGRRFWRWEAQLGDGPSAWPPPKVRANLLGLCVFTGYPFIRTQNSSPERWDFGFLGAFGLDR